MSVSDWTPAGNPARTPSPIDYGSGDYGKGDYERVYVTPSVFPRLKTPRGVDRDATDAGEIR